MNNDSENPESKYEVREVIGKGAFGEVNLVVERQSKQRYVLKRIKMARQSEWQRRATRQEIEIVSRLRHPFVMPYKEHWIHHGHTINVVYGYCEKGDLTSAITKQRGKLFPEHTLRLWLAELLLAVDYMHRQNVLHRDIKTQNILLTGDGDVQIGDFGLSTVRVPSGEAAHIPSCDDTMDMSPPHVDHHACADQFAVPINVQNGHPNMQLGPGECKAKDPVQGQTPVHDTKAGTRNDYALVGTPHFMSPELLSSQKYSYETDIWSLGVVMYELTTLKPPFNAFNLAGLVAKIKRAALPPIPTSYSADWVSILKSMLRKDPTRRANPLELLAIPTMQQALQQAHLRAMAMSPDYVLPDIPLLANGVSPGFCFAPSMGSGGGAAAAQRTPSAGEAAITPVLIHPPISGGGDADFGMDMEADTSPVSAFPNLASAATESPLPSRPAETRAAPAPSGSMTARVTSAAATTVETGRSKTPSVLRRQNSGAASSAAKHSQPVTKRHVSPPARSATARLAPAAPAEVGPTRSKTPARAAAAAKVEEAVPTGRLFRKASLPREARSHTPAPKAHVPATPRERSSAGDTTGHPASPAGTTPAMDRQLSHKGGVASGTVARTLRTGSTKRSVLDTVGSAEARGAGAAPLAISPIVVPSPPGETESDVATPDALNVTVDSTKGFSPSTGGDSLHKSPLGLATTPSGAAAAGGSRSREAAPWRSASATRATRNALSTISSPPPMPTRRAVVAAATTVDGSHHVGAPKRSAAPADDTSTSTSSKRASSSGTGPQPESILHAPATARARVTASPVRSSHTTASVRRGSQPGAATAKEAADGFMSARQPRVRRASYTSYDKPSVAQQQAPQLRRQQSAAGAANTTASAPHVTAAGGLTTTKDKKGSNGGGGAAASPARAAPAAPKLESFLMVIPSDSAEGSPAGDNSPIVVPGPNTCSGTEWGPSGGKAQSEPQALVSSLAGDKPSTTGPAVASPSPGAAAAPPASSPATSGHPWRAAPRSRSVLSVTTEDSDLSMPDGRYFASEVDTGGRASENDVITAAAAMSTAGPVNVSTTGAAPFWSSNQLFSGNYSSYGAALAAEAVGTAVGAAATAVVASGASEPTAPAGQQSDAAPALSADLPRRVSASAFASHLKHDDVATDGAAGNAFEGRSGSMGSGTDSASSSSPETQQPDSPLSHSADVTMASTTASPSAQQSLDNGSHHVRSNGSQRHQARRSSSGQPTDASRLSNTSHRHDSAGFDFAGATEDTSRSTSSSSATGADVNSPLLTVAEDEAGEAESSATCSDAPVPFSSEQISLGLWGSEREQLIRLQRVVALAASLWEAGRDTELGAVLSSTLTRPLVRRVRTDPLAAAKVTAHGVQQRTQQRLADPGDVVYVSSGPLRGVQAVVRYRGPCHWGAGNVLGLELAPNTPYIGEAGSTDAQADLGVGARDGVTYFHCQQPNHRAVFVPLEHAILH